MRDRIRIILPSFREIAATPVSFTVAGERLVDPAGGPALAR